VHVNIVDLVESRQLERKPKKFPSVAALSGYTRETHMFFSREKVKEDKLLRVLLRRLV
jgi:hypothetical protein